MFHVVYFSSQMAAIACALTEVATLNSNIIFSANTNSKGITIEPVISWLAVVALTVTSKFSFENNE